MRLTGSSTAQTSVGHDRGFALPMVLLIAVALVALSLQLFQHSSSARAMISGQEAMVRGRTIADAALHRTIAALADKGWAWPVTGQAQQWQFDGATVTIRIENEHNKISLNNAPPALIGAMLHVLGMKQTDEQRIVDRVTAWRDETEPVAEADPSSDAGVSDSGPGLRSLSAFLALAGIDPAFWPTLEPHVTIHSDREQPDPLHADDQVLLAIDVFQSRSAANLETKPDDEAGAQEQASPLDPGKEITTFDLKSTIEPPVLLRIEIDVLIDDKFRSRSSGLISFEESDVTIREWVSAVPVTDLVGR